MQSILLIQITNKIGKIAINEKESSKQKQNSVYKLLCVKNKNDKNLIFKMIFTFNSFCSCTILFYFLFIYLFENRQFV